MMKMAAPPAAISFFVVHGWVLWSAWCLISVLQLATARYLKHLWQMSMWLHRIGAFFVTSATLFYGIYGWQKLGKVQNDWHAPMGIAVVVTISFVFAGGLTARYLLQHQVHSAVKLSLFVKTLHKVSQILWPINAYSGLRG